MKKIPLKAVTYNIHRGVGLDGRYDPSRIAGVLSEIKAEVIGLQEVDTGRYHDAPTVRTVPVASSDDRRGHPSRKRIPSALAETPNHPHLSITDATPGTPRTQRVHQLSYLAQATGYTAVEGLIIQQPEGAFGNALLSCHPVQAVRRIDLTVRGAFRRRGALDVDLDVHGKTLRILVAHLGLGPLERYIQIRRILKALGKDQEAPVLIMGDFNLLSTLFRRFRRLQRRLGPMPPVRTFPAKFPVLALDRLWVQPHSALRSVKAHITPLSRVASDHLPLVGTLQL